MNKQWLEAFIRVSQKQKVSMAAKSLYLSQPSVSSRIQALENELGQNLFLRTDRGMLLTEAGQAFLPYAEKMLDTWDSAQDAVRSLHQEMRGKITLALFYGALPFFTPCLTTLREQYPDIRFHILSRHSEEVGDFVLNHEAHLGIVRQLNRSTLSTASLLSGENVLVVADESRLEKDKNMPFIMYYSSQSEKETFLRMIEALDRPVEIVMETDNLEVCKQFVIRGLGLAIMPYFYVATELERGELTKLKGWPEQYEAHSRGVDLVWSPQQEHHRLVSALRTHIVQFMATFR